MIGQQFLSKYGIFTIIDVLDNSRVKIEFKKTGYQSEVAKGNLRKVKDYLAPSVYGKGFLGEPLKTKEDKAIRKVWQDLLKRAYSEPYHKTNPAYKDVTVDEEWFDFRNFKAFYNKHYIPGYQLDKDIVKHGNKHYSPKYCVYLPQKLNKMIMKVTQHKSLRSTELGVTRKNGKFISTIKANGEVRHLGTFDTAHEAHLLYMQHKLSELKAYHKLKVKLSRKAQKAFDTLIKNIEKYIDKG